MEEDCFAVATGAKRTYPPSGGWRGGFYSGSIYSVAAAPSYATAIPKLLECFGVGRSGICRLNRTISGEDVASVFCWSGGVLAVGAFWDAGSDGHISWLPPATCLPRGYRRFAKPRLTAAVRIDETAGGEAESGMARWIGLASWAFCVLVELP